MTRKLSILVPAIFVLAVGSPTAIAQAALVNYEATYRLTLGDIDYKGAVITAKGAMAMRVKRDCTRWQSHTEYLFLLELDNGNKIRTHTMFRERESLDGQNIEFNYWQDLSDSGRLEYRGNATIPGDGEAGTVRFLKPKRFEKKLPKGVEMPITAMREIVETLAADGTTAKHNYFDPQAKFVEIRSIGGDPIILANQPRGDAGLVDGRSWRLRATPIPEGQEDKQDDKDQELKEQEEEAYTMMQIHDSGVASYMEMKSGITTIHAELVEVKQLPVIDCSRPKPPEPELAQDCIDGKPVRKEDDLAQGEKPEGDGTAEGTPAHDLLADVPSEEASAEKDCEVVVEKEEPVEGEEVQAAPVGEVETEPSGDATEPEAAEPEPIEEPVETGEPQQTDEATQPELFNASVTGEGN